MNKNIKIALSCAVMLLFIGGSIAAAEQTKFGDKTHTAAIQNEKHLLPGQIIMPGGHIINESDQEKNVIKRGTVNFKLPKTASMKEHRKDLNNLSRYLKKQLNLTPDNAVSIGCNSDNCTYEVIKTNETSSKSPVLPAYNDWVEDAYYFDSVGPEEFSGYWTVPSAPSDPESQTIFYFIDEERTFGTNIIQPVLGWNWDTKNYPHQWIIGSAGDTDTWYWGTKYPVNVGDTIGGDIWYDSSEYGWDIDTYDITTGSDSFLIAPTTWKDYVRKQVTLEVYSVNTCNQFSGSADFYNLQIDSITPSWGVDQKQTGCGLGVDIVSPSEVMLNT